MMGDAAFGMSGLDLETAVRAPAPITTVLLNNSGMATYPPGNFATARERFGVSHIGDYVRSGRAGRMVSPSQSRRDGSRPEARPTAQRRRADR